MFNEIKSDVNTELSIVEEDYLKQLSKFRTSRASITILDGVMVDYYGAPTPINQLATVSLPEANLIQIQPWDVKTIENIEKSIQKSDIGFSPVSDGRLVRIPIPPLSEERRKEIVKKLHKYTEERKTSVRNIRRSYRDKIKNLKDNKDISEDDEKRYYTDLQKIIDNSIEKIDKISKDKEKHILED